jgi:hypothetical protein
MGDEQVRARLKGVKPPAKMREASRRKLTLMFEEQFKQTIIRRREVGEIQTEVVRPFIEIAKANEGQESLVKRLAKLDAERRKQKLVLPHTAPVKRRTYIHSVGLTETPPYDWPWTWKAANGSPPAPSVNADQKEGNISFDLWCGDSGGAVAGAAAVGFYFQPAIENIGVMQFSASPALSWEWWTYNVFDSSHSDGWIGLYVGSYDMNGTQYTHVDQRVNLWDESHSFLASPDGAGSNSGFPLTETQFINSDSFYEVWVWCGGSASADGSHTVWGSWAGSKMHVSVPFMHIEYWG